MLGLIKVNSRNKAFIIDKLMKYFLMLVASLAVLILVLIFFFLLLTGSQTFSKLSFVEFIVNPNWNPTSFSLPSYGIFSLMLGTLLVSGIALTICLPLGLVIAIYLSEIATRKQREIIKPLVEMIACIPSVVIGVLGLVFVAPAVARVFSLSNGLNALTAGLLVAIAALPSLASLAEDALFNVNWRLREASLALGATDWLTIVRVVLPAAKSGLMATIMLSLGRIIGETMIVLMVAGNSRAIPNSIFSAVSPMTSTIAVDVKEVVSGSLHYQSLFAIGLVLFVITFVLNLLADFFAHHEK